MVSLELNILTKRQFWEAFATGLFIKAYREFSSEVQQVFKRNKTTTPARCSTVSQLKWKKSKGDWKKIRSDIT